MKKIEPLRKFCVFCGNKPEKKTNEHIIPQWLIKLTGDPNRTIRLGIDMKTLREKGETKILEFSFSSFKFPACKVCNEKYSLLEVETKTIVEKILRKDYVTANEINTLLNWLDKVRVGLWLGYLLLDRGSALVDPNFFIEKRIAEKDRYLFVYETNDNWKGVQFTGFNTPAFSFSPSCFMLTINNFHFYNVSSDFIISKNIGFPYANKKYFIPDDNRIISEFTKGTEKIRKRLIKKAFLTPSIEIYQPIIPSKLIKHSDDNSKIWNTDYVKNNCINYSKGIGKIFYREQNKIIELENDIEICLSDDTVYEREKIIDRLALQVFDQQLDFIKDFPSIEKLNKEGKKRVRELQNSIIDLQKKFKSII